MKPSSPSGRAAAMTQTFKGSMKPKKTRGKKSLSFGFKK